MKTPLEQWIATIPRQVTLEDVGTGQLVEVTLDGVALREAIFWAGEQARTNDRGYFNWKLGSGRPVLTARKVGK